MQKKKIKKAYEDKIAQLEKYDKAYFNDDNPVI